jgi:pimeloyl-ACP methyl ester carboxylesterase
MLGHVILSAAAMTFTLWIALMAIFVAAAIWSWISSARWRMRALLRLRDQGQIVETARGPVECALFGEGPAVFIAHGAMGGYDQGLAAIASGFFGDGRYRFIAVSRPGYLRTPPEVGRTPEEQADAFKALLDAARIEKTVMVGISAGGPPALQFALRHANRCLALLLVSAATERIPSPKRGDAGPFLTAIMQADFLAWLILGLVRRFPKLFCRSLLSEEELRLLGEPEILKNLLRLIDTTAPISVRRLGLMTDGKYLTTLPAYPLASIRVPTLVLHGTSDKIISFASGERSAATIPGAQLVTINDGSHFACLLGRREISAKVQEFLETATRL